MTSHYRPRRVKRWQLAATSLRFLALSLRTWPLWLLAFLLLSPVTPHMLWEYQATGTPDYRVYHFCRYAGVKGMVVYRKGYDCPFITLIDHREIDG